MCVSYRLVGRFKTQRFKGESNAKMASCAYTHSNVRNFPRKQLSFKQQFSPSLKMKINFKWSHQGSAFKIGDVIDQPPLQERKVCPGKPKNLFLMNHGYKEKFPVRVDFFFFLTWKKNKNKTKVFLLVIRH